MIYGYIRVSTDKQTVENQKYEIKQYAKKNNIHIDKFIDETTSGLINFNKRKLGRILTMLQEDDTLIASELSRLGRSLYMIMTILNICMTKKVKVITIKDKFHLDDNIESKVLAFAFGLSAEIERKLISERTKEALERIKKEGKTLGRPKGSLSKKLKLQGCDEKIKYYLEKNRSKVWIAKHFHVHVNTLKNYLNNQI